MDGTTRPYTDASGLTGFVVHHILIVSMKPLQILNGLVKESVHILTMMINLVPSGKQLKQSGLPQSITMPDEVNEMITLIDNIKSQFPNHLDVSVIISDNEICL